jgi:L-2-amino-thiazoline-4-carboxylic acid hydrolase
VVGATIVMKEYRTYFTKSIRQRFPAASEQVIARTEHHYAIIAIDTQFAATSANPIDRRLDFSAYFLAMIKALDERGESFAAIREICLEIVTEYVRPKNWFQRFLRKLPPKMVSTWLGQSLIRKLHKRFSNNTHPDGFIAHIITDKQETYGLGYGFDILECGICKLYHKHDSKKYASILCEVDEVTSGLAGLKLIRSGTIANGAHKCDFRFQREK